MPHIFGLGRDGGFLVKIDKRNLEFLPARPPLVLHPPPSSLGELRVLTGITP